MSCAHLPHSTHSGGDTTGEDAGPTTGPAALRRADRQVQPRAFDALIAAVALAHDLPVYTCNSRDFAGIDGLEVVTVPPPGRDVRR